VKTLLVFLVALLTRNQTLHKQEEQPFILANFYAKGVPNSAIQVFPSYFNILKRNFATARAAKFSSSTDKIGNNDRNWSVGKKKFSRIICL
jgi:hypothetical protein